MEKAYEPVYRTVRGDVFSTYHRFEDSPPRAGPKETGRCRAANVNEVKEVAVIDGHREGSPPGRHSSAQRMTPTGR